MTKNLDSLWSSVLAELKLSLSKTIFTTLFVNTKLKSYKNQTATIKCPNSYLADLIKKRYASLVQSALDRQTGEKSKLEFEVEKEKAKQNSNTGPLFKENKNHKTHSRKKPSSVQTTPNQKPINTFNKRSGLSPLFNFNNFVVGDTNHFAFAAAQGIVKQPGNSYNPLFIWGGVGVGKTHLLHAIGNRILNDYSDWKILCISGETFGNELVASLKEQTTNKFKHKYRNVDVFLVDDIQFIAGKEYIQDEFFHTFNDLYLNQKQIVLTSDRKPEEIQPLKDRLTSRFMGGLTVDVQSPDFEMRVAILKQKSEQRNISITDDAVTFIAETIESNARELEGKLTQIAAAANADNQNLNLDYVKNFFGIKNQSKKRKSISYRRILSVVAKHYDLKTKEVKGRSRKKQIVTARHIAAYLLRKELEYPLKRVGEILGGRDHTTVMHSEEKIDRLFSTNQEIRHDILEMRKKIYA
jgi:chromosomal replication initiator protein